MVRVHAKNEWGFSMNLGWFGVPPSGGSNGLDRLKPGLQAVRGCMVPMHGHKTVKALAGHVGDKPTPDPSQEGNWPRCGAPLLGGVGGGFTVLMHAQSESEHSTNAVPWRLSKRCCELFLRQKCRPASLYRLSC